MVLLGLDFQQILSLDEKHQVLQSNVWLKMVCFATQIKKTNLCI
ncbi:unnamed protein product [Cylicostephanus goldi]|uniref:Neurotransmitter-gated ion-channel ligand-binding domain-containing protein n=1 Tax=Cylicostephanus goldi TaxID=71465 RepID=A0A3P7MPW6_CYLGO|nr:unnamed protein product [Cylicostephanus goldi]